MAPTPSDNRRPRLESRPRAGVRRPFRRAAVTAYDHDWLYVHTSPFAVRQVRPTTTISASVLQVRPTATISASVSPFARPRFAVLQLLCKCARLVLSFDVPATAAIRRSFRILQLRLTTTIRVTFTRRWSPGRNCSQQLRPHFNSCVSVSPTTVRFLARTSLFRALTCRLRSFRILQLRLTTT